MFALLATVWTQNVDVAFQYEIRRTAPLAFLKGVTLPHSLPTLRSRSPCASWAPSLHRGLVRGSFPAPHHHDPNEMLPNFAFWVMVAAPSCRFTLGIFSFSTTLRTQVRPAIEFVSGKEGLRPLFWLDDALLCDTICIRTLQVRLPGHLEDRKRPLAPSGVEGRWQWRSLRPLALPSFVARFAPLCCCTPDAVPLFPVQRQSI